MAAPSSIGSVAPKSPRLSRTSGRMARGTPNSFSRPSSQSRVFRFHSMVREALVTSVACTRPLVRFQISQLSMVPKAMSLSLAPSPSHSSAAIPAWWPRNRDPAAARSFGRCPAPARASSRPRSAPRRAGPARRWRCAAARRCLVPDQRGLALVGDADGRDLAGRHAFQHRAAAGQRRLPDLARVMLDPAIGGIDLAQGHGMAASGRASPSNRIARVEVVPWSMARR